MPRRRSLLALLLCGSVFIGGLPQAIAHQRADLSIVAPAEGEIYDRKVDLVVDAAGAALSRTEFSVQLDEQPVDTTGRVGGGSVFTTFSLATGERLRLSISVPEPGDHELRLVYARDGDDPRPDVVRRFSTGITLSGSGRLMPWSTVVVVVLAGAVLAAVVLLRRRRGRRTTSVRPDGPG